MERSICFVTIGDMKVNATAKRALGLSSPLAKLGWHVSILMMDTEENHHQVNLFCTEKINIIYFPVTSACKENQYKKRVIEELNPSVVFLSAFNRRNFFHIPKSSLLMVEQCELFSKYNELRYYSRILAFVFEILSVVRSDAMLVASKYLYNVYIRRSRVLCKNNMPILYLPYAFNGDIINISTTSKIIKEEKTFVYIGSIRKQYGVYTILKAAEILKQDNYNFKIYFLGVGSDFDKAKNYIFEHSIEEKVKFCGYVKEEDISSYFSIADAFLSPMNDTPQDWARCPSKLYMYLPYKKPIITCKIGEPYETLKDDGLYYSPSNSVEMAQCMKQVIRGEKSSIQISSDDYSWMRSAEKFSEWLSNVTK